MEEFLRPRPGPWRLHGWKPVSNPLKNSISDRLFKNDEVQGARILRNEAYIQYAAMTKDEAQRSKSRFSTAC